LAQARGFLGQMREKSAMRRLPFNIR